MWIDSCRHKMPQALDNVKQAGIRDDLYVKTYHRLQMVDVKGGVECVDDVLEHHAVVARRCVQLHRMLEYLLRRVPCHLVYLPTDCWRM
jgi:hypothetical protein